MRITLVILIIVMISVVNSETLEFKGKVYNLETKQNLLKCSNFSILTKVTSLPFSIRENNIPYEVTMKHMGNPYLINEKLFYIKADKEIELANLTNKLPNYKKIDPERAYTIKPEKCLGETSVLFRFWGGGNCNTVCEVYIKAKFNEDGDIPEISGLTYKEYRGLLRSD